jgi:hypothetical protein
MAVPLKQLLADSKRLVARDLFDPANAEVTFTISSNDLPAFTLLAASGRTSGRRGRRLERASGGSEGLGVGEDGREAPQQTDGARGASGNWSKTVATGEFN